MTELHELLRRASESDATPVPVRDDLARARAALRRYRMRRVATASLAVFVIGVGGAAVGPSISGVLLDRDGSVAVGPEPSRAIPTPRLVPADLEVGPYVLGRVPHDWELQAEDPVVFSPTDDSVSADPANLTGKLVVIYAVNPVGDGKKVTWQGQEFVERRRGDMATVTRETQADEPRGSLSVQYPIKAFPQALALEFAAAVHVTAAATPDRAGSSETVPDSSAYAAPVQITSTLGAPTELPAIASHKDSWLFNNGALHHEYSLAGAANADTATPEAIATDPTSPAVHPATYLTVSFNPEVGENAVIGEGKLQIPADPKFNRTRTVDINGAVGKLTTSKNGLGVIRLDWIDAAGNYHVVKVDRLQTSDGTSGLSANQILAIGRSIK